MHYKIEPIHAFAQPHDQFRLNGRSMLWCRDLAFHCEFQRLNMFTLKGAMCSHCHTSSLQTCYHPSWIHTHGFFWEEVATGRTPTAFFLLSGIVTKQITLLTRCFSTVGRDYPKLFLWLSMVWRKDGKKATAGSCIDTGSPGFRQHLFHETHYMSLLHLSEMWSGVC